MVQGADGMHQNNFGKKSDGDFLLQENCLVKSCREV